MLKRFTSYVDERFRFVDAFKKEVLDHPVPPRVNFMYCFGGITFFLFVLLVASGMLMAAYYVPSTEAAYASIEYFQFEVPLGGIVRGVHHWSANLMMLMIFLHMIRVFMTGSYKKPMEFHWVSGVVLFLLTMGMGFTGYLLPWNQKAYWASKVGINMPSPIPVVGELSSNLLQGGEMLGALTISRFYAMHVIHLPLLICIMLGLHFWMIRRTGIAEPL
jgi:menaquinol-cytochrome c reductase cytochrome b subunit